jgi:hypothetical protein
MSTTPIDSSIVSLVQACQTLLERPDLALEAREALQELQFQDALISDEIMDQITAQQLPTLTALPDNVVIVEDQDFEIDTPEPRTPEEPADAPELYVITEPIRQPLPNVLSPRTALSALSNPHISTTQVFEIAVALANTANRNRKDFAHQTELYEEAVARLEQEAHCPAPADDPPPWLHSQRRHRPLLHHPGQRRTPPHGPLPPKMPWRPDSHHRNHGDPQQQRGTPMPHLCRPSPLRWPLPCRTPPLVPRPPPQPVPPCQIHCRLRHQHG